ncbi:unnamed protein product, partial [Prorocentrum cordatum]
MDPRFSIPDPPYCAGLLARPVFPPPRSAAIRLARRGTAASGTEPRALAPEPLSEGKHDVYHTCLLAARLLFAVGSRVPSLDTGNASGPSLKSWSTCWLHKVDCPVMVMWAHSVLECICDGESRQEPLESSPCCPRDLLRYVQRDLKSP